MVGVTIFEIGNCAATLLILRATDLLTPGRDTDTATQLAIGLYVAYNAAATLVSVPAGHVGDRTGARGPWCSVSPGSPSPTRSSPSGLTRSSASSRRSSLAGIGIGIVETAEHSAVAAMAPARLRGSAFGLLAAVQSGGNLAASAVAGILYTVVSPAWAFGFLAAAMVTSMIVLTATSQAHHSSPASTI